MYTVVETPGYLSDAKAIYTDKEPEGIVTMVANDPECGEVMQGTVGVRKVRWDAVAKARAEVAEWFTSTMTPIIQSFCWPPSPRTKRPI